MNICGFILSNNDLNKYNENVQKSKALKKFQDISVFQQVLVELKIEKIFVNFQVESELLTDIYNRTKGYDYLFIGYANSDFYCLKENKRLLKNTLAYHPDYAFGDNYPLGVVGELLFREALPVMENMRKEKNILVSKKIFQEIIEIDINCFDLENLYLSHEAQNLRTFRLSLFEDNQQDRVTVDKIKQWIDSSGKKYNKDIFFNELSNLIVKNRSELTTIPKYYEIEISRQCLEACVFCPKTQLIGHSKLVNEKTDFMPVDQLKKTLKKIKSYTDEPVIAFTGMGDPALHPDFEKIIELCLEFQIQTIIETSLVAWSDEKSDFLLKMENQSLVSVVFSIDAINESLYRQLRPLNSNRVNEKNKKEFSLKNTIAIGKYLALRKPKTTYFQLIKMKENFEEIIPLYKYFSEFSNNVIIQKYNHYQNQLEERRINPMVPFEKIDCWHLKRNFFIKTNGNVVVCKQDIHQKHILGDIFKDEIEKIADKRLEYLKKHVDGWNFCKNCDESYTYCF